MKTSYHILIVLLMTLLMVTGIVLADDPIQGTTDTTTLANLGWQEHTKRTPTLYSSLLKLSTGVNVGLQGPTIGVNVGADAGIIECCKYYPQEHYWCNFNADHAYCPN